MSNETYESHLIQTTDSFSSKLGTFSVWSNDIHHLSDYNLVPKDILGRSKRSIVLNVEDSSDRNEYVIKLGQEIILELERTCLQSCSHPNIVLLKLAWVIETTLFLKLEKVIGISLVEVVKSTSLDEKTSSSIFLQIGSALSYLHSSGWIHRDVKPDNIIYDEVNNKATLIDFEFSTQYENKKKYWKEEVGTLMYWSPEKLLKFYNGPEVDMWALSATLYVMVIGRFPFERNDILNGKFSLSIPENLSKSCIKFLKKLLEKDLEKRLTNFEDMKSKKWLKQYKYLGTIEFQKTSFWKKYCLKGLCK